MPDGIKPDDIEPDYIDCHACWGGGGYCKACKGTGKVTRPLAGYTEPASIAPMFWFGLLGALIGMFGTFVLFAIDPRVLAFGYGLILLPFAIIGGFIAGMIIGMVFIALAGSTRKGK